MRLAHLVSYTLLALVLPRALAQSFSLSENQKITPEYNGFPGARFGQDLAVSGDTALVGSPARVSSTGAPNGRVHAFTRDGAGEYQFSGTLFPLGLLPTETFGRAVAIDGDVAVVGSASAAIAGPGAAYVFRRTAGAWMFESRLSATSNQPTGGGYGYAVDIDGSTIVVSDPSQSGNGRVYVYRWNGAAWLLESILSPAVGSSGMFGEAVALDGDLAAVGQLRSNQGVGGEVRLFRRFGTTWTFEQSVQPFTPSYGQFANDWFGSAVDVVGSTLLVGAPHDQVPGDPTSQRRGAAFVFTRVSGVWSQAARLAPPIPQRDSRLGASVALGDESHSFIGANGEGAQNPIDPSRGAAYSFVRTGSIWGFEQQFLASGGIPGHLLGVSVAVAAQGVTWSLLAGAPRELAINAGAVRVFDVLGAGYIERTRLLEPVHGFDRFGNSVAVDGDMAVVGAPLEDTAFGANVNFGSAHLYQRQGALWSYLGVLSPPGLSAHDRFGSAVGIQGSVIAIGAPNDDHSAGVDAGSVYVFERINGSWVLTAVLIANDAAANDFFGSTVDVASNRIVVGSPLDDNAAGINGGAAYIFEKIGGSWNQASKLASSDLAAGDFLGTSVAFATSSRVLVGAPGAGTGGAAYVFDRTPLVGGAVWGQRTRLLGTGVGSDDLFGQSVAAFGQRLVVGAPLHNPAGIVDGGAAFYFESSGPLGTPGNTFMEVRKFTALSSSPDDRVGTSVAIDASTIAAGAPETDTVAGVDAGRIHVFRQQSPTTWLVWTAQAVRGSGNARYGSSLTIESGALFVGAFNDSNNSGGGAGAVHVVDLWTGGPVGISYCGSEPNTSGLAALLTATGSPVRANNNLVLHAARLPLNVTGIVVAGRTPGFAVHPGGSQGNLCLTGAIGRFLGPGQIQNSGATGTVDLAVNWNALPQPSAFVSGLVGETWHFQAWFRDTIPAGPTSNFTDGLAVVLH